MAVVHRPAAPLRAGSAVDRRRSERWLRDAGAGCGGRPASCKRPPTEDYQVDDGRLPATNVNYGVSTRPSHVGRWSASSGLLVVGLTVVVWLLGWVAAARRC